MIIDEILEALVAFEAHGKPARTVFLGYRRMHQLRRLSDAYRSAFTPEENTGDLFFGLPVKDGDFPPDYIGFGADAPPCKIMRR